MPPAPDLHLDATLGPVGASIDGASFLYNPTTVTDWSFAGGPASVTAQALSVSGTTGTFTVSGLGSVTVTGFSVGRQLGATGPGGTGDLFSLTLTGIALHAGGGSATLDVTGGPLTVYSWVGATNDVYAAGSNLGLSVTLGPVSGSTTGVSFLYNPSTVTDWSFAGGPASVTAQTFSVSGGATSFSVSGLGSVGVGGFSIGRQLGVSGGPSAGDLFSLTLTGITLHAGGSGATLDLTNGNLTVYSFVGAQTDVYAAGANLTLSATLGPVAISAGAVSFLYNPSTVTDWSFAGGPASVTAQTFSVSGGSTSVSVTNLGSVGVDSFAIARQLNLTGPGGTGNLFSLTLTGIVFHAGGANATLDLTSGNLTVYSWVGAENDLYVAGSNLTLSATLGPLSGSSSSVSFLYNPSTVTDWSFAGGPASVTAQTFSVSGGPTSFSVTDLGSVGVDSFSVGRRIGINGPGGSGDLFSLTLTGIALDLGGANATLHLSNGSLTVYSFVTSSASDLYVAGSGLHIDATLGPASLSATGVSFLYNPSTVTDWSFAGGPASVTAQTLSVSGGTTTVTIADLGSAGVGGFSIGRRLGVSGPGGSGDLFTLTLTGITLTVGTTGASLTLTGGELDVFSFVTSSTSDLYAAGSNLGLTAALGPVTGSATGVSFLYNPSTVTDWSFAGGPASVTAQTFSVAGGSTSLTVTGLGSVGVDSFSILRQTGVSGVSTTGDLFTLTLTGISISAGGAGATLTLTGGELDVDSFVTSSTSYLYVAGTSLTLAATLGPLTASATGVSFLYNPSTVTDWSFAGVIGAVDAQTFRVSGGATGLTVTGLGSVGVATFSIVRQDNVSATAATSGTVTGTLFTVSVTGATLHLGTGGAQIDVTGGSLDLLSFTTASASWFATTGSNFSLSVAIGPVSLAGSSVAFQYNSGPAGDAITNWTFAGGPASLAAGSIHLSGAAALSIGTFLAATTDSFTLDHTTASGSDNASSSPITLTNADVWAFSLGSSHVFVGLGAALTPDSGAASGYDVSDGTVGVAATISGLKVATITQGTATYTGVEADGIGGSFIGIDPVTLTVSGVKALYNASSTATKLNWAGLDSGILPFAFDSSLTRALSFHLAGSATVSFDSFVTGTATFAVTESDVDVTTPALTGASLLVISLTSPTLQIGVGSFGLSLGGAGSSVTIASLTPGTPDGRSWTAVQATGLTGSLTIGSLATATLTGVSIDVNSASGTGATPLDWNGVAGSGITLGGATPFAVSGTLSNLAIAGFVSGSATFTVSESTINVTVGGVTLTGATLLTLGLGSLNLNVGSASGPHFSITGGSLAIAALSAPTPGAGTDTRSWLGVIGAITSASLVSGIPDVGLTVDDLTLRINEANGAYTNGSTVAAAALDWTTALDLNTNGTFGESPADQLTVGGIPIDLTGATLTVSGTANVQLFGMITGEVAFAFQQQTVSVDVDRDGTLELPVTGTAWARGPPGPDLQNATLTTFGLSVPSGQTLTFGVGGVGFSVSAGSLALAIVTPSASAQAAGDGRSWLALDAQITSASFTGIPGLTLTVTGLTVEINRASGVYTDPTSTAAVATQALNWTKSLDLDGDGVFGENPTDNPGHNDQLSVPIGGGGTVSIAFTGTTSLRVTGTATISLASIINGTVGFALTTQTVTGTNIGGVTGLSSASLTTLALTATSLFVGWSGIGFQVNGGGLAIASLTPSTPDGRSWLGVQADLSAASLTGVPGLTLAVSSLQVGSNTAAGGASPLDWTKVQTGGVAVLDANGVTHTIAFTGDTSLVVSGDASVDVAGLLGGSAHFVITQSTVDVPSVGLTGATLLTVALSNLQLAVGTTSIGAQITSGTLTIGLLASATDSKRWFGLSSSGISASLVLPSVTATVSNLSISVNEASGGATPIAWATVPGNPLGPLSGPQLSADGDLSDLSVFGILSGSAHVSFARQTVDVQLGSTTFLTGATLLSFSLSLGGGETLQAGVSGFGLTITNGTLLIAAIAPAASSDGRRWIAVQGTGLAATLTIPGITATVSSVDVSFNGGTGGASAINWTTNVGSYDAVSSTFTAAPVDVVTGGGSTQVTLTAPILTLSGHLSLSIGSFLSVSADFVLTRSTIALDLNGDGTADITGATLLTLGLSNVNGTLGAAGGPNIAISGGSLALASISAPGASATWTAIEGTISGATLNGVPGLVFTASSLTLDVNSASGTYGASIAAPALNWATMLDLNRNGHFGESADQLVVGSTTINLNGAQVAATGTAHVNLFGFVDGTVSFSFQQQQVSVDVDGNGIDRDGRRERQPDPRSSRPGSRQCDAHDPRSRDPGRPEPDHRRRRRRLHRLERHARSRGDHAHRRGERHAHVDGGHCADRERHLHRHSRRHAERDEPRPPDQPGERLLHARRDHGRRAAARLDAGRRQRHRQLVRARAGHDHDADSDRPGLGDDLVHDRRLRGQRDGDGQLLRFRLRHRRLRAHDAVGDRDRRRLAGCRLADDDRDHDVEPLRRRRRRRLPDRQRRRRGRLPQADRHERHAVVDGAQCEPRERVVRRRARRDAHRQLAERRLQHRYARPARLDGGADDAARDHRRERRHASDQLLRVDAAAGLRLGDDQPLRSRLRHRRLLADEAGRHERRGRRRPRARERDADDDRPHRLQPLPRRRRCRLHAHERLRHDRDPLADGDDGHAPLDGGLGAARRRLARRALPASRWLRPSSTWTSTRRRPARRR